MSMTKKKLQKKTPKPKAGAISQYDLAERVKYMRLSRNYSQQELARKSKVSQSTIAQIESGKKDPSITTLKKLAQALEIEMAILFATEDILVFDLKKLKQNYKTPDDLHPTIYMALGKVVQFARDVGFI